MRGPQNRQVDEVREIVSQTRRPYAVPGLIAYGEIHGVTSNVGNKGTTSDGGGMFAKTT